MRSQTAAATGFAAVAITITIASVSASSPAPVSLEPGELLGIDGIWSTVRIAIGSPSQYVNVLPSTSLSELWTVGPGGCLEKEPHCIDARGEIFNPATSKEWTPIGIWQLGLDYLGYGGNGQYGLDTLNLRGATADTEFRMSKVLTSNINATDYFNGYFGLNINHGNFSGKVVESPLTQAVESYGLIPSYSYGYTAGASYKNISMSLTLGGYDSTRFVSHDSQFKLTQQDNMPRPLVRGIEVFTNGDEKKPDHWDAPTKQLSTWDDAFLALIDSTTPYLWLPEKICDQFANAFDLTYNSTFDLYTITNEQYRRFLLPDSYSFTFSLSSIENRDNFGLPLDVPGVVNITIPMRAFVQTLNYPFHHQAMKYGDPAVPYFSLRKAKSSSSIIIGRAFLQESYLITKYDQAVFSVHQALFPQRDAEAKLVSIEQPNNSPYPPPHRESGRKLNKGQVVGIGVGAILSCLICLGGLFLFCRRRTALRNASVLMGDESKDSASTLTPDSLKTPVSRILSKIGRRKRPRRIEKDSIGTDVTHPSEAPDSEIYEMPAPLPPAELDGAGDDNSILGETEFGTDDSQNMSAYEIAQRKIDRQLQGPVPEYSPPINGLMPPPEKSPHHLAITTTIRQAEAISPVSPIKHNAGSESTLNSLPMTLPSPISPRTDWNRHSAEIPSPVTATMPPPTPSSRSGSRHGPTSCPSSGQPLQPTVRDQSNSDISSVPMSPTSVSIQIPAASFQRSPIDPSKVVCLGPLPDNIQVVRHDGISHVLGPDGRNILVPAFSSEAHLSEGSLGSNYTVEEQERIMHEMTRQNNIALAQPHQSIVEMLPSTGRQQLSPPRIQTQGINSALHSSSRSIDPGTPHSEERIDGRDLIHVPQMAEKRYSWEEER